jgi:hypothetical protein
MPTPKQSSPCDQVSEIISDAIRLVREILAERPAATVNDSIPKRRETVFFDII